MQSCSILERIAAAGFDDVADVLRYSTYSSVPRPRARGVFFEKTSFVNSPKPLTTLSTCTTLPERGQSHV
jgi:hypothetical protein